MHSMASATHSQQTLGFVNNTSDFFKEFILFTDYFAKLFMVQRNNKETLLLFGLKMEVVFFLNIAEQNR